MNQNLKNRDTNKYLVFINIILLFVVLVLFNTIINYFYHINVEYLNGVYIYPLDDAYIHLAMAKNVALYGNWGVVYDEFCSTSSSPIYTSINSLFIKIFGNQTSYPFIFNLILANLVFISSFFYLKKKPIEFTLYSLSLLGVVLLHVQVLSGMEHVLHIFLILNTTFLLQKVIDNNFSKNIHLYIFLLFIGLLCLTRYESMFYITAIFLVFILFKQYKLSFLLLFIGFTPVVLFGLYSISNGGYFFPNSLLVKGKINIDSGIIPLVMKYLGQIYKNLTQPLFLVPILILIFVTITDYIKVKNKRNIVPFIREHYLIFITFTTILLHSIFADFGWVFRYEAYLYCLLYLVLIVTLSQKIRTTVQIKSIKPIKTVLIITLLILIILLPMRSMIIYRINESTKDMIMGSRNIFNQQIQMALFLKKYYSEPKVVANDIGAICYFNKLKLTDLVGLGSNNIFKLKRENNSQFTDFGQSLHNYIFLNDEPYKQYDIIIIYDQWFQINTPEDYKILDWTKVFELKIDNNVICGSDKVSFYSNNAKQVEVMKKNIELFKKELPKGSSIILF